MSESTTTLKRVQILLNKVQYQYLVRQAREKGQSLSSLVRELLEKAIQGEQSAQADLRLARQTAALKRLARLRETLYKRWGGYAVPSVLEDLDQLRQERDAELAGLR